MATGLRLEVAHAVLYVHDTVEMIEFYTNALGFAVTDRGPFGQGEIIFMSQNATDHHQIAFITGRQTPDSSNSVNHVAFRSGGSLDDLRALKKTLAADVRVTQIVPLCHGNAWSVYFRDPEFNGLEVFIDTPWHVRQPQGQPLDLDKSNDEIIESDTRDHFSREPEFGPIEDFYRRRAEQNWPRRR